MSADVIITFSNIEPVIKALSDFEYQQELKK